MAKWFCNFLQPSNHPTIQPSNHQTIKPSNHPTIQPNSRDLVAAEAEACKGVGVGRAVLDAVGGAAEPCAEIPAAAAHDPAFAVRRADGIHEVARRVVAASVLAPFVHVAVHIEKSPRVGGVMAGERGTAQVRAAFARGAREIAVAVGAAAVERISPEECRFRACAACVFPFCFGGKARAAIGNFVESVAEFLAVVP